MLIFTAATCTWHISTHFWCCESAVPWHNLASNETDAEHIEPTEYGYEDIESCIGKQTLISNLLRQPTVQRLKSDNVRVTWLHRFWQEQTNRHYQLQSFFYAAVAFWESSVCRRLQSVDYKLHVWLNGISTTGGYSGIAQTVLVAMPTVCPPLQIEALQLSDATGGYSGIAQTVPVAMPAVRSRCKFTPLLNLRETFLSSLWWSTMKSTAIAIQVARFEIKQHCKKNAFTMSQATEVLQSQLWLQYK